ncbi:hypothetical protein ZIOFF_042783 [Zingiber officinale]|uniref:Uncharacterized protein n=1 Tax=Zingiber officinale TaxID=94328 RepID=A0A8J5KP23_ZINOF|nr:hypothetical protein ZIOFF_042783 [Zingiber officinale]
MRARSFLIHESVSSASRSSICDGSKSLFASSRSVSVPGMASGIGESSSSSSGDPQSSSFSEIVAAMMQVALNATSVTLNLLNALSARPSSRKKSWYLSMAEGRIPLTHGVHHVHGFPQEVHNGQQADVYLKALLFLVGALVDCE